MIKHFYELTKPGIVYGNALTALAGFVYGGGEWILLPIMLLGLSGVIASACVFNNIFDRDLDAHMERTKNRPIPSGAVSPKAALWFGIILFAAGVVLLSFVSAVATLVAIAGHLIYVSMYTPLKRISPHALWVGAVAGATPPVVGYAAATQTLDTTALLLFTFLFVWQIPHFLAIAVYRNDEYKNATIPLLMRGPYSQRQKWWARQIFWLSLVVLLLWVVVLMVQR